jgi:hypothetical protein
MSPALHEFLTIWLLQGCFLFGITVEGHLFLCIHYSVSQSPWSSISASTIVYFCEDLGDQPYRFALLTAWFILKRTTKPISYAFLLYYYRKILFNSGSGTHDSYLLFYLSTEFFGKYLHLFLRHEWTTKHGLQFDELMNKTYNGCTFFRWIVGVLETKEYWTKWWEWYRVRSRQEERSSYVVFH